MPRITRRAALSTTARAAVAVVAGGGVAVAGLSEGDQALHALMAELQAALADQAAAGAVSAAASDNYDLAFQDCKARNANWEGECNRAWEECGLKAAEEKINTCCRAVCDIAQRIAVAPAATLTGVRLKLSLMDIGDRYLLQIYGKEGETLAEDLVISIAADLDRWGSSAMPA